MQPDCSPARCAPGATVAGPTGLDGWHGRRACDGCGRREWHNRAAMPRSPAQLILIPGLAANAVMWRNQLAALSARWRTEVSLVHFAHDRIEDMAAALLREHEGELVLCGASMGGIIAMEAVRQAPQRIRGLALLGTNARPENEAMRALRCDAIRLFEAGRSAEVLRANLMLAFHASRASDAELTGSYLSFLLEAGSAALVRQNRAIMDRPDARGHLAAVRCPTLVLCGDSDLLTPPECSREIAALIGHAELQLLAHCGHMLTMEQPEAVNAALLA